MVKKLIGAALALTLSQFVLAQEEAQTLEIDCPRPDALVISIDGANADENQMMEAQSEVQAYADSAQAYLLCLQQLGQETSADQQEPLVAAYNSMVEELQGTVDEFNVQVRAYQASAQEAAPAEDAEAGDQ